MTKFLFPFSYTTQLVRFHFVNSFAFSFLVHHSTPLSLPVPQQWQQQKTHLKKKKKKHISKTFLNSRSPQHVTSPSFILHRPLPPWQPAPWETPPCCDKNRPHSVKLYNSQSTLSRVKVFDFHSNPERKGKTGIIDSCFKWEKPRLRGAQWFAQDPTTRRQSNRGSGHTFLSPNPVLFKPDEAASPTLLTSEAACQATPAHLPPGTSSVTVSRQHPWQGVTSELTKGAASTSLFWAIRSS